MSLSRWALRLLTRKALLGVTWAESRIFLSEMGPIDATAQREQYPFVIIYTDNDKRVIGGGRDLRGGDGERRLSLWLEMGVASAVKQQDGGVTIVTPETDEGLEGTTDFLEGQVVDALLDPYNTWGELWRRLVFAVHEVNSLRGADAEKGVRFAARGVEYVLDTVADPVRGAAPDGFWADLLTAVEADDEVKSFGPYLRAYISNASAGIPAWRIEQSRLGLSYAEVRSIGLASGAPPDDPPNPATDAPPLLSQVTGDQSLLDGTDLGSFAMTPDDPNMPSE